MAQIVNERDLILQSAAQRILPVDPPTAIIIEGFTGISLAKDISMFVVSGTPYPVQPERCVLTATLKGIPLSQTVTWTANVPLTDTPDPLVKLIEAKNYPTDLRFANIHVSVTYGGQEFFADMVVFVFNG